MSQFIPSREERREVEKKAHMLVKEVKEFLGKYGYDVPVIPVGSAVVGTFVSGDHDIDIFVVSEDYLKIFELFKKFRPEGKIKWGELNIWNFKYDDADVDLVVIPPTYGRIGTLAHSRFYREQLTDEMKDEVVKGKLLFKTYGVYGAEIGGIVGVAIQELIRQYKTLYNLCEDVLKWEHIPFLQDPALAGEAADEKLPVEIKQRARNMLSSVAPIRLKVLKKACRDYMERGLEYVEYTIPRFIEEHRDWRCIVRKHDGDRAKAYTYNLHKCVRLCNELKNMERDAQCECDAYATKKEVVVCFKTNEPESDKVLKCVPKSISEQHLEVFKKRHPDWFEKDEKICVLSKRKIMNFSKFMEEGLK